MLLLDFQIGRETRKEGPKGHTMRRAAYASSECNTTSAMAAAYGRPSFSRTNLTTKWEFGGNSAVCAWCTLFEGSVRK